MATSRREIKRSCHRLQGVGRVGSSFRRGQTLRPRVDAKGDRPGLCDDLAPIELEPVAVPLGDGAGLGTAGRFGGQFGDGTPIRGVVVHELEAGFPFAEGPLFNNRWRRVFDADGERGGFRCAGHNVLSWWGDVAV